MTAGGRRSALEGVWGEAAWLAAIALVLAAGSWALRPDGLPLKADPAYYRLELAAPLISPEQALEFYDQGEHLFVDTRPADPPVAATIPGAVPIRAESFDDDLLDLFDFLGPEDPLVLFGDGRLTGASNIAARLAEQGYSDIVILDGGIEAWARAGGELRNQEAAP